MSILNGLEMLSELTDQERSKLSLFCQEKLLKKGDILFLEGEEATAMYLLRSGKVEISQKRNGKDIVLGNVNAEEILGEMALFGKTNKRMATAKAIENCELVIILSFSINEIISNHTDLLKKIKKIIKNREELNKNIQELKK